MYSLYAEIPPQRTGMISCLFIVDSIDTGLGKSVSLFCIRFLFIFKKETGCTSILYKKEDIYHISFLKYKTSQANNNAIFTYKLSDDLSSQISRYIEQFGSTKKRKKTQPFWMDFKGDPISSYELQNTTLLNKFANKNNAFLMTFKNYYFQRSKKLKTPTTLRKSFVTYLKRIGDDKLLDEAASAMLHSKRIQEKYYTKLTSTEKATTISNYMKSKFIA